MYVGTVCAREQLPAAPSAPASSSSSAPAAAGRTRVGSAGSATVDAARPAAVVAARATAMGRTTAVAGQPTYGGGRQFAGFWSRFGASLIDGLILSPFGILGRIVLSNGKTRDPRLLRRRRAEALHGSRRQHLGVVGAHHARRDRRRGSLRRVARRPHRSDARQTCARDHGPRYAYGDADRCRACDRAVLRQNSELSSRAASATSGCCGIRTSRPGTTRSSTRTSSPPERSRAAAHER